MNRIIRKTSVFVLAAALISPVALLAQKEDKEKDSKAKKEVEQVIITLKGDKKEKITVEVNGDDVTINGKPLSEFKSGDISVSRHTVKDRLAIAKSPSPFSNNWNFNDDQNFQYFNGDENRAMLGVTTEKTEKGVEVQDITKESAAEKAGLKKGDIITKIADAKIAEPDDLVAAIKKSKPGDKVTITYLRDEKEQNATAELSKWKGLGGYSIATPGQNFKMTYPPDMDMRLDGLNGGRTLTMPRGNLNGQLLQAMGGKPKLGLSVQDTEDGKGVKVIEVDDEGNAKKAGIKENDVITDVDGKAVNTADEVAKIIRESKDKVSIMVKLQRDGKTQNIEVKIPKKLKTADL